MFGNVAIGSRDRLGAPSCNNKRTYSHENSNSHENAIFPNKNHLRGPCYKKFGGFFAGCSIHGWSPELVYFKNPIVRNGWFVGVALFLGKPGKAKIYIPPMIFHQITMFVSQIQYRSPFQWMGLIYPYWFHGIYLGMGQNPWNYQIALGIDSHKAAIFRESTRILTHSHIYLPWIAGRNQQKSNDIIPTHLHLAYISYVPREFSP